MHIRNYMQINFRHIHTHTHLHTKTQIRTIYSIITETYYTHTHARAHAHNHIHVRNKTTCRQSKYIPCLLSKSRYDSFPFKSQNQPFHFTAKTDAGGNSGRVRCRLTTLEILSDSTNHRKKLIGSSTETAIWRHLSCTGCSNKNITSILIVTICSLIRTMASWRYF